VDSHHNLLRPLYSTQPRYQHRQAGQRDEDVAIATSTFVFLRSLGQTFGVALGGVIFQNQWNKNMANLVAEHAIPPQFQVDGRQAEGIVIYLSQFPPSVQQVIKNLFSESLRAIWIFFIPLAGVAILVSVFMRNHSLDKVLNSKQAFEEKIPTSEESKV